MFAAMSKFARLTVAEQVAEHLREGFRTGRWSGTLPGVARLARELNVATQSVCAAVRLLEGEGLIVSYGQGRRRTIADTTTNRRVKRVGILLHDTPQNSEIRDGTVIALIRHELEAAGYEPFFTRKSQAELRHDVPRIKAMLTKTPADLWIAVAASRELLEWFSKQSPPCMALYGRTGGLPIARTGPDKVPAYQAATRRLIELGHRRIVLITLKTRRIPVPGAVERAFLEEMAAHGISTGDYNLPDWTETPEGFKALLEALFRTTPPTALIIDEATRLVATMEFLLLHGIKVPGQVSLVSTDNDLLNWCSPGIAHMSWNNELITRRVMRWVRAVGRGQADRKTINVPVEFVPGGSIGPATKD